MLLKKIKVGSWYKTRVGVGKVIDTTNFRGFVRLQIVYPFPRGIAMLRPGEVQEETVAPVEGATEPPKEWAE